MTKREKKAMQFLVIVATSLLLTVGVTEFIFGNTPFAAWMLFCALWVLYTPVWE